MDMEGADWWQQQQALEQLERTYLEAERSARDLLAALERLGGYEAAASQELADALAAVKAAIDALSGLVDNSQAETKATGLTFDDALRLARGCFDYRGGYHRDVELAIYRHGIQTVINVLEAARETGLEDSQLRALHVMGG